MILRYESRANYNMETELILKKIIVVIFIVLNLLLYTFSVVIFCKKRCTSYIKLRSPLLLFIFATSCFFGITLILLMVLIYLYNNSDAVFAFLGLILSEIVLGPVICLSHAFRVIRMLKIMTVKGNEEIRSKWFNIGIYIKILIGIGALNILMGILTINLSAEQITNGKYDPKLTTLIISVNFVFSCLWLNFGNNIISILKYNDEFRKEIIIMNISWVALNCGFQLVLLA